MLRILTQNSQNSAKVSSEWPIEYYACLRKKCIEQDMRIKPYGSIHSGGICAAPPAEFDASASHAWVIALLGSKLIAALSFAMARSCWRSNEFVPTSTLCPLRVSSSSITFSRRAFSPIHCSRVFSPLLTPFYGKLHSWPHTLEQREDPEQSHLYTSVEQSSAALWQLTDGKVSWKIVVLSFEVGRRKMPKPSSPTSLKTACAPTICRVTSLVRQKYLVIPDPNVPPPHDSRTSDPMPKRTLLRQKQKLTSNPNVWLNGGVITRIAQFTQLSFIRCSHSREPGVIERTTRPTGSAFGFGSFRRITTISAGVSILSPPRT